MEKYKLNPNQVIEFFQSKGLHPKNAVLCSRTNFTGDRGIVLEIPFDEKEADKAVELTSEIEAEFDYVAADCLNPIYFVYYDWPENAHFVYEFEISNRFPLNPILTIIL